MLPSCFDLKQIVSAENLRCIIRPWTSTACSEKLSRTVQLNRQRQEHRMASSTTKYINLTC